jgi:hypothetical protein
MMKKNKQKVWWIVFFVFQLGYPFIFQALTYYFIRQDVALLREQLMENGVAVSSLSPMIWTIRSVGSQVSSMATSQIQILALMNTLMFFFLYRLCTKEKPDTVRNGC